MPKRPGQNAIRAESIKIQNETPCEYFRYLKIWRILRDKPVPTSVIAKKLQISQQEAVKTIRALRSVKLVCVDHVEKQGRAWVPFWTRGAVDKSTLFSVSGNLKPGAKAVAFKSLLKALEEPIYASRLSEETGLCYSSTRRFLKVAKAFQIVYICSWTKENGSGNWTAEYKLGANHNKEKPKAISREEINRRHNEKRALNRPLQRAAAILSNWGMQ